MDAPTDNIIRSAYNDRAATVADDGSTLYGHFSVFGNWYEVNSSYEGRFLERIMPGAFVDSLERNASRIAVLYDHGYDPQLGNKPLGTWTAGEDARGAWYEVSLIDAAYNRDFIIPAARAGLLGSSFRFSIPGGGDTWEKPTRATSHNPDRLRERSIHLADVWEFGPVTFPANPEATAAIRSTTDEWHAHLLNDRRFLAYMAERMGAERVANIIASLPDSVRGETPQPTPVVPTPGRAPVRTRTQRQALAAAIAQGVHQ